MITTLRRVVANSIVNLLLVISLLYYSDFIYLFYIICLSIKHQCESPSHPPHCFGDGGGEHGDDAAQPSTPAWQHPEDQIQPRRRTDHHWHCPSRSSTSLTMPPQLRIRVIFLYLTFAGNTAQTGHVLSFPRITTFIGILTIKQGHIIIEHVIIIASERMTKNSITALSPIGIVDAPGRARPKVETRVSWCCLSWVCVGCVVLFLWCCLCGSFIPKVCDYWISLSEVQSPDTVPIRSVVRIRAYQRE